MKFSRDGWLAIGVVSLLILVTIAAAVQQTPTIPYLSTSSAADGTLALKLWLADLGYPSSNDVLSTFQPPQDADLLLILQPLIAISDSEWSVLDQRVQNGATLILAGDNGQTQQAFAHYGFSPSLLEQQTALLTVQDPLLTSPLPESPIPVKSNFALLRPRSDFVTLLAVGGQPVLVSFDKGAGRIILSATPDPFSNLALKDPLTASLVLNLVSLTVHRDKVWFDEWHHGLQASGQIVGPDQWLRQTPLGHALLFLVGAVFLALLLQGRAFGRPVPLPAEIKRRSPLEHVTAIANLSRKAGHRNAVLAQYYSRLKRHLGRRYSLDPSLPDADYVRALAVHNPALDQTALLDLLQGLSQKNPGDDEMVRLAAKASAWMKDAM
jgi:Domain of unknown function (DUF4350)